MCVRMQPDRSATLRTPATGAASRDFAFHKKELRVAHRCGYNGNPEADRDTLQSASTHETGRGPAGYDGVLRLQESTMAHAADTSNAEHQWRLLHGSPAVVGLQRRMATIRVVEHEYEVRSCFCCQISHLIAVKSRQVFANLARQDPELAPTAQSAY